MEIDAHNQKVVGFNPGYSLSSLMCTLIFVARLPCFRADPKLFLTTAIKASLKRSYETSFSSLLLLLLLLQAGGPEGRRAEPGRPSAGPPPGSSVSGSDQTALLVFRPSVPASPLTPQVSFIEAAVIYRSLLFFSPLLQSGASAVTG